MPSDKQTKASRTNGAKSRGPVTPQGKINSSGNSLRHGLLARTLLLKGDSRDRFYALMDALYAELQPETHVEVLLLERMAAAQWRQARLWAYENRSIAHEARKQHPNVSDEDSPTRHVMAFTAINTTALNQYEMRFDRQFLRAYKQFSAIRAAREKKLQQTNPGNDS